MPIMTVEQLRDHAGDIYKFVRVDGRFRYCELSTHGLKHSEMVKQGEKATAAGSFFLYRPSAWKMSQPYSMTLNIGCKAEDEVALAAELLTVGFSQKPGGGMYD